MNADGTLDREEFQLYARARAEVQARLIAAGLPHDTPAIERVTAQALALVQGKPPPIGAPIVVFGRDHVEFAVKQHAKEAGAEATLELLAQLAAEYEEADGDFDDEVDRLLARGPGEATG